MNADLGSVLPGTSRGSGLVGVDWGLGSVSADRGPGLASANWGPGDANIPIFQGFFDSGGEVFLLAGGLGTRLSLYEV